MSKLRLVVADDSQAFLTKLTALLSARFNVVRTAKDGIEALELIRSLRPDVAVLDLEMPGLSGIEVIHALNHDHIPIVICTTELDTEIAEAVRQAGALGYVSKVRIEKELVLAIEWAFHGNFYLSSGLSRC